MSHINQIAIEKAVQLLKTGKLVAIPTETVYGLAADALNPHAVQKIYQAKGRPAHNPLIIHLPDKAAMPSFAIDIPPAAWVLADIFWPGPLTLVLPKHPKVPSLVTGGQETVALRVPQHPVALELLHSFGGGLAAPSANRYGRISPTTAAHVAEELGEHVDFILEGGPCTIGIESTIVYLKEDKASLLRLGNITAQQLANYIELDPTAVHEVITPGKALSHYAPNKPLYLLDKEHFWFQVSHCMEKEMVFAALSFMPPPTLHKNTRVASWLTVSLDPLEYAQTLYARLRDLDKAAAQCILVEMPPLEDAWQAILDRLQRAAFKEPPHWQ
jgi:L-threonylcarbamoyladenylate synthase